MGDQAKQLRDSVRDPNTGLIVRVRTDAAVPGNAGHRHEHLHRVDTELARVLGAALASSSESVMCNVLGLLELSLQSLIPLARMDEKELERYLAKHPELTSALAEDLASSASQGLFSSFGPGFSVGSVDELLDLLNRAVLSRASFGRRRPHDFPDPFSDLRGPLGRHR